jgi:uncharacterized membrane protein
MQGVIWNLFLATIPVVLGYMLEWGMEVRGRQRNLPVVVCIPFLLVWLVFLPNTCYLLTEWRHLLFDARWAGLLDTGASDGNAMLSVAKWGLFFFLYSGTGVLLFTLSIRPVERMLRAAGQMPPLYAPFFFFLMSLGVYLGLKPRLNSWDILANPLEVWGYAVGAIFNTAILSAMVLFAMLLWAMYEAVDLWVDGIAAALRRWGLLPQTSKS